MAGGAISEIGSYSRCRVLHVNVGALRVRFEASALRDLPDTFSAAMMPSLARRLIRRPESAEM
jgi:hypothetical protein